ncbi:hypothetical protein IC575_025490 [Cucumis melo]
MLIPWICTAQPPTLISYPFDLSLLRPIQGSLVKLSSPKHLSEATAVVRFCLTKTLLPI